MIYGFISGVVLAVLAYIQYLRTQLERHQNENAMLKSQQQQAEWKREIDATKSKVTETERDYEDAKKLFHDKYGTGPSTSSDGSGSNTKS